jgi:hypothetical protein
VTALTAAISAALIYLFFILLKQGKPDQYGISLMDMGKFPQDPLQLPNFEEQNGGGEEWEVQRFKNGGKNPLCL